MKTLQQQEAEFHAAAAEKKHVVVTGATLHALVSRLSPSDKSDVAVSVRAALPAVGNGSRRVTISHDAAAYLSAAAKKDAAKAAKKDA